MGGPNDDRDSDESSALAKHPIDPQVPCCPPGQVPRWVQRPQGPWPATVMDRDGAAWTPARAGTAQIALCYGAPSKENCPEPFTTTLDLHSTRPCHIVFADIDSEIGMALAPSPRITDLT